MMQNYEDLKMRSNEECWDPLGKDLQSTLKDLSCTGNLVIFVQFFGVLFLSYRMRKESLYGVYQLTAVSWIDCYCFHCCEIND